MCTISGWGLFCHKDNGGEAGTTAETRRGALCMPSCVHASLHRAVPFTDVPDELSVLLLNASTKISSVWCRYGLVNSVTGRTQI